MPFFFFCCFFCFVILVIPHRFLFRSIGKEDSVCLLWLVLCIFIYILASVAEDMCRDAYVNHQQLISPTFAFMR